jgi:hypothetical protein
MHHTGGCRIDFSTTRRLDRTPFQVASQVPKKATLLGGLTLVVVMYFGGAEGWPPMLPRSGDHHPEDDTEIHIARLRVDGCVTDPLIPEPCV